MSYAAINQTVVIQPNWYNTSATVTTTATSFTNCTFIGSPNSTGYYITGPSGAEPEVVKVEAPTLLLRSRTYEMPDGSKVIIDENGGFKVEDTNAKVLYRAARVRNFNPFMNAADMLEEYIKELIPLGIRQDQVLHLEIESFIFWLVHKAAEQDRDPVPIGIPRLPARKIPRCGYCKRFIRHAWAAAQISFCSPIHMERQLARIPSQ